jgi:hypothetical protein
MSFQLFFLVDSFPNGYFPTPSMMAGGACLQKSTKAPWQHQEAPDLWDETLYGGMRAEHECGLLLPDTLAGKNARVKGTGNNM